MAGAPFMGFGQQYAKGQAAAYDPVTAALNARIQGITGRMAGLPESVGGLYSGAEKAAGSVGADVSNIGTGFLGALSGMSGNLPGLDPTELVNAARSTARAGATGSMLGSVLGTQVGQAKAGSLLEAQSRLAQEQAAAQDQLMQTQLEQAKVASDWMTPAAQRQQMAGAALSNQTARAQLAQIPVQNRAAALANMAAKGQIDAQILNNLDAMKKLGLSQADMVKARKLYGGVKAKGASGAHSGSGGNPAAPTVPVAGIT